MDPKLILLLSPRQNANSAAVGNATIDAGWDVRRLPNWRPPEDLVAKDQVVAYGEPLFVTAMAEAFHCSLIEPTFDWLPSLPYQFTKRQIELTTLALARLYDGIVFAKPADDKCIAASVYENGSAITASSLLPENIPVLLSEVVQWSAEYRFFILERDIATYSLYAVEGALAENKGDEFQSNDAYEFVRNFLSDEGVALPPALALDVGKIADRGWAVVEANPAFGAGIYFCDPQPVGAGSTKQRRKP